MKLRLLLLLLLTLWCWTEADTTPSPLDEAAIEQNDATHDATRDKRYPFWNGKICNKQCEGSKDKNCGGKCSAAAKYEWRIVYAACMKNDNCEEWIPGCMPKCRSEANAAHPAAYDKKKRDATLDATREKREAEEGYCENECGGYNSECIKKCKADLRATPYISRRRRGEEETAPDHGDWEHQQSLRRHKLDQCQKACDLSDPVNQSETSTTFPTPEMNNAICTANCFVGPPHPKPWKRDATRREKRGVCEHKCGDDIDADCIQKCKARLREAQDIARRRRASEETVQSPELIQCKKDCAWDRTWICEEQNCMHLEPGWRIFPRKLDATRREKRGVCEHRCADDNDADCIEKCKARLREAHDIGSRR